MSVAVTKTKGRDRPTISPEKGSELAGLVLFFLGLFLALSLVSYYPEDPSLFHHTAESSGARNWTGAAGAHVAAVAFGFLGVTCLLVPFFLLVAAWRRLRRRGAVKVVGRGFGVALLLAATPPLLQLTLGDFGWRGGAVASGGGFGTVLVELLRERLNFMGTLLVLATTVICGLALAVQSTLGAVLGVWRARLQQAWQDYTLARERRKERRAKERARRRVITKHLQRVMEEKQKKVEPPPPPVKQAPILSPMPSPRPAPISAPALAAVTAATGPAADSEGGRLDLPLRPLRVTERRGEAEYSVRRVSASELQEDEEFQAVREALAAPPPVSVPQSATPRVGPPPARRAAGTLPQPALPFVAEVAPGTLPPINLLQMGDGKNAVDEAEL
ncbi:MAG TPA: DNA translocase FtsK 4TM domain-containing protein, partial [Thermoanaerobaculia bacterium]|nr:DNA translocase FtsK 4TM domain-containing protein [Thermoanaerobaculia bacterium]